MTAGPVTSVDLLSIRLPFASHARSGRRKRIVGTDQLAFAQIVILTIPAIDVRGIDGHRAVEKIGSVGIRFCPSTPAANKSIAATRPMANAANNITPPRSIGASHHLAQFVQHRLVGMLAVAVGAFANQVIAGRRRSRIVVQRRVVAAHVAGKQDARRFAAATNFGLRSCEAPSKWPAS